jgi:chromosome segregation ATPase
VLSLLAGEVKGLRYDIRAVIRELMLTQVYQRSCELSAPDAASADVRLQELAQQLSTWEAQRTELTTAGDQKKLAVDEALAKLSETRKQVAEGAKTLAPLQAALVAAQAETTKAQAAVTAAQADIEKKKQQSAAVAAAAAKAKEAAELIKDDKVLADAAAKIAERAKATTEAEAAAERNVVALTAALEEPKKKEQEAQSALDKEAAAFPSPQQIVELESAERAATFAFNEAIYAVAELDARATLAKLLKQHAELQKNGDVAGAQRLWGQLVEELSNRGQVALLKPLTAEQFALSAMQATGFIGVQQQAAEAAVAKAAPEEWKKASDAEKPLLMQKLREPKVYDNVKGQLAEFIRLYGGLPGQDYQATVNQALFFGNGSVLEAWLKPTPGNLIARLQEKKEPAEAADELYTSIFSRPATEDEKTAIGNFLKDREDKPVALAELAWALLASTEFRFNH